MTCAETRELLSPHLDTPAPDVDAHVARCTTCAAELRRLQELRGLLRAFEEDEEIAPDPAVLARRVHEAARKPAAHPLRGLLIAALVVAITGTAVPVTIALTRRRTPTPKQSPPPAEEQEGTLSLRLNAPDRALLDKVSAFFKECPLSVEERREGDRTIEIRCHGPGSSEWASFSRRVNEMLNGLRIQSGSWEWRTGRKP